MTATMAKNTTTSAVNGRASWNACPIRCSSVTPVNAVAITISGEADEPYCGHVKCQRGDEQQCRDGLHDEHRAIMRRAIVRFGAREIL